MAYELQPNESFVHKSDRVMYGTFSMASHELLLTSLHIVLLKKGMFGGDKAFRVFPLQQVKVLDGRAQAFVGKQRNGWPALEVYFLSGVESFGFEAKREANFWAQKINELLTGTQTQAVSSSASNAEKVADVMKGTVDALKGTFGFKTKAELAAAAAAVPVAGRCNSCGAPVSGTRGQAVVCSYCDLATQL